MRMQRLQQLLSPPCLVMCQGKERTLTSSLDMVLRSMRRRFLCDSTEERPLSSEAAGRPPPWTPPVLQRLG